MLPALSQPATRAMAPTTIAVVRGLGDGRVRLAAVPLTTIQPYQDGSIGTLEMEENRRWQNVTLYMACRSTVTVTALDQSLVAIRGKAGEPQIPDLLARSTNAELRQHGPGAARFIDGPAPRPGAAPGCKCQRPQSDDTLPSARTIRAGTVINVFCIKMHCEEATTHHTTCLRTVTGF